MVQTPIEPTPLETLSQHYDAFRAFVKRRVPDPGLAEDLLHDVFERGINRAHTLRDEGAVLAWFYRSLRNAVVDQHRRHDTARRALDAFAAEIEAFPSIADGPTEAPCPCIARAQAALRPEYAHALKRIEIDGLSVKDFAGETGITAGNAAVRVHRARAALRSQLGETCGPNAKLCCGSCNCAPGRSGACGT